MPTTEVVRILAPSVVMIASAPDSGADAFGSITLGTGVILDEDGHILTNNHVVEEIEDIIVTLHDGRELEGTFVGGDVHTDIAVIKVADDGLRPASLGDSSILLVGQDVVTIGHTLALGDTPTVSKGIISALDRTMASERDITLVDLIQTDAIINLGNSGGPLANMRAEVVGITTSRLGAVEGIGFSININDAGMIANQLIELGAARRGFMGVVFADITPFAAIQLGLDRDLEGVMLTYVIEGGASWDAGLRANDIILAMNGQPMPTTGDLLKFLVLHPPGETVEVEALRDDERLTLTLTLAERPAR